MGLMLTALYSYYPAFSLSLSHTHSTLVFTAPQVRDGDIKIASSDIKPFLPTLLILFSEIVLVTYLMYLLLCILKLLF